MSQHSSTTGKIAASHTTETSTTDPYEFSDDDARLIADLAKKMRFVGLMIALIGALVILHALLAGSKRGFDLELVLLGMAGALLACVGAWSIRAGGEFGLVDATEGHDIRHLMSAIRNLRKLYTLEYTIVMAAVLGVVGALLFGYMASPLR